MKLLAFSSNDIDTAGRDFEVELPPAWLSAELSDADLTAVAPGQLRARLSRSGEDIVVRGRVKAELSAPCARCMDATPIVVDTELSLLLKPAPVVVARGPSDAKKANGKAHSDKGKSVEPEYEFSADEADVDHYDGETVLLDPFVREAILLEIPNFPLCSEACPGIRPAATAEAEADKSPRIDPRLAPLDALRAKLAAKGPSGPAAEPSKKKNTKE